MVDEIDNVEIDIGESEESEELSMDDFKGSNFIKNPDVGESITLNIEKVIENKNISGENKETGAKFDIGLKDKNGNITRYDIHTEDGVYTINSWEVYFKLFDNRKATKGLLIGYAETHNKSFKGAKVSIKRLHNGSHANRNLKELAKLLDMTEEEAKEYQNKIKQAMKEHRLYEVKLIE